MEAGRSKAQYFNKFGAVAPPGLVRMLNFAGTLAGQSSSELRAAGSQQDHVVSVVVVDGMMWLLFHCVGKFQRREIIN